ncbi:hypothetical protein HDU96_006391 [Phlyctochytrium bullatum]|nr:hypothetical protein HDU96_006391 [Phlyctochytrium bullatum]
MHQDNVRLKDDEVLSVVDELRSLGTHNYISLPQIVVVGDQSSGKSSLLEYISGVPFPKGTDMCTTFATQVIMGRHPRDCSLDENGDVKEEDQADGFRAEIKLEPAMPGIVFEPVNKKEDVEKVITSIKNQFKQRDGQQHIITDRILTIKLFHRTYPRLTLVDLPGYVHVKLDGQADTIVEDIRKLADRYIKEKRSIVLAVVPATSDIANNIVLTKVKKYDPEGLRTMCIITKPDRLERGHIPKIVRAMSGHYIKLDHGYHLICNRTAEEFSEGTNHKKKKSGTDYETQKEKERRLFDSAIWNEVDRADKGIDSLVTKLVSLLRSHVKDELPVVLEELRNKRYLAQSQLLQLGTGFANEDDGKKILVLTKAVTDVIRKFNDAGNGRGFTGAAKDEVDLRATLVKLGNELRSSLLTKSEEFECRLKDADIAKLVASSRGRELEGFLPYTSLKAILERCVREWSGPLDHYVTGVFKCVRKAFDTLFSAVDPALVFHFKLVGEAIMKDLERRVWMETKEVLVDDAEYPYTFSPRFLDTLEKERAKALITEAAPRSNPLIFSYGTASSNQINSVTLKSENYVANELRFALRSYLGIAVDRLVDTVSLRVVERFVFRQGEARLRDSLLAIDPKKVKEDERVTRKRKRLEDEVLTLEGALKKVSKLQED